MCICIPNRREFLVKHDHDRGQKKYTWHRETHKHVWNGNPKRFSAENNRLTVSKFHNSSSGNGNKNNKSHRQKLFLFCDACSEANKHFYIFYSISEPEAIFRQNNETPSQRFNNGTIDPVSVVIRFNPVQFLALQLTCFLSRLCFEKRECFSSSFSCTGFDH